MSRLQVGGLALVLDHKEKRNIGKVVKLISFIGKFRTHTYGFADDYWEIEREDWVIFRMGNTGRLCHRAKYLLPLGDKQTQDEFKKELECVE